MKPKPCFAIVGTDTEVGKTMVACGLARALTNAGHSVIAVKPVETGCSNAHVDEQDGTRLAQATGQSEPAGALLRFPAPVAPPVAADLVGEQLIEVWKSVNLTPRSASASMFGVLISLPKLPRSDQPMSSTIMSSTFGRSSAPIDVPANSSPARNRGGNRPYNLVFI